ncbi:MAG: M43 family zinc metalloprotease [Rubricoccaceae bacterium]|nr:M43 family zinc metalloprotease [Rubricoccaceae bacterium]
MRFASSCAPALRWSAAFLLLAFVAVGAQAQHAAPSGTSEVLTPDTHILTANGEKVPAVRCAVPESSDRQMAAVEAYATSYLERNPDALSATGVVTIPVAFNVVYSGGQGNVPEAWLDSQINVLNNAFDGTTGGFNTSFRFVKDRVNRVENSSWYTGCYSNPNPMKLAMNFSPRTHLNFYTCSPSGGILGFAVFPWSYPENDYRHGVVVLDQSLPGGNAFPYNQGDTGTHEVGHYLGLYHTFQGGCFGGGDLVSDTPPESSPAFGCPFGRDTCSGGGVDPIRNFMDYTDDSCMIEFTEGQSIRMDAQTATYRPTIWATKGGGGCDLSFSSADMSYNATTRILTIQVTVQNSGSSTETATLTLDYNRNGGNPQGTRSVGSFNVGAGSSSSQTYNLSVPSRAPAGTYNLTLNLEDGSGSNCDDYAESFFFSAPRVGEPSADAPAPDGELFAADAVQAARAAVSPNPFARETAIRFEVAEATDVRLAVYDVLGREVAVLADGRMEAGAHTAVFQADGLAAGTYVYRLVIGSDVQTGRMTLAF